MNADDFLYFAYGSNMSVPRIQARIPGAEFVAVAYLPAHCLTFSKPGIDDSGKCDALYTGDQSDHVCGVVYRISAADKMILDGYEGLGHHYLTKPATVLTEQQSEYKVFLYVATEVIVNLKPYHWYRTHVLHGAKEAGLPQYYIEGLEKVTSIADPDPDRHAREMAIY